MLKNVAVHAAAERVTSLTRDTRLSPGQITGIYVNDQFWLTYAKRLTVADLATSCLSTCSHTALILTPLAQFYPSHIKLIPTFVFDDDF